jgi:hypothetical protein
MSGRLTGAVASSLHPRAAAAVQKSDELVAATDTQVLQRMHVGGGMSAAARGVAARTHRCCWVKVPGESEAATDTQVLQRVHVRGGLSGSCARRQHAPLLLCRRSETIDAAIDTQVLQRACRERVDAAEASSLRTRAAAAG